MDDLQGRIAEAVVKGGYNKDSFFDTLSNEAQEKADPSAGRRDAAAMRARDTETFGAVRMPHNRRGGGGNRSHNNRGYGRPSNFRGNSNGNATKGGGGGAPANGSA